MHYCVVGTLEDQMNERILTASEEKSLLIQELRREIKVRDAELLRLRLIINILEAKLAAQEAQ